MEQKKTLAKNRNKIERMSQILLNGNDIQLIDNYLKPGNPPSKFYSPALKITQWDMNMEYYTLLCISCNKNGYTSVSSPDSEHPITIIVTVMLGCPKIPGLKAIVGDNGTI